MKICLNCGDKLECCHDSDYFDYWCVRCEKGYPAREYQPDRKDIKNTPSQPLLDEAYKKGFNDGKLESLRMTLAYLEDFSKIEQKVFKQLIKGLET